MKVLYMSHRYHTNQNTIMKGWKENGHEVCFISQYEGKIEEVNGRKGDAQADIACGSPFLQFIKKWK